MSTPCLRCGKGLEEQQVDTVQARFCRGCRGFLLAHADLIRLLEQSWRFVPENKARATDFHASSARPTEPTPACPDCGQRMDRYGYLGYAAIPITRCDRCALVWLDSDELQNMVLALAKLNYHIERDRQDESRALDLGAMPLSAGEHNGDWLFEAEKGAMGNAAAIAQLLLQLLFV